MFKGAWGQRPQQAFVAKWIATSIACRYLVHKKFSKYSCIFFSVQLLYKYRFMILFFIGGWEDMARKAYSEEDRVQVRNALMTTMIQCIADRGLIHSSIDVLCRKVEISKTFFYSFFSSKEELVLYRPAIPTAQAAGLCQIPNGGPRTQLAGGSGNLSEKLLLWS